MIPQRAAKTNLGCGEIAEAGDLEKAADVVADPAQHVAEREERLARPQLGRQVAGAGYVADQRRQRVDDLDHGQHHEQKNLIRERDLRGGRVGVGLTCTE